MRSLAHFAGHRWTAALRPIVLSTATLLAPTAAWAQDSVGTAAPNPAPAATKANDSIGTQVTASLKDGSSFRGVLTELSVGDHATLRLASGQSVLLKWNAIARIDRVVPGAQASMPEITVANAPPVVPLVMGPRQVVVRIAEKDVRLERHTGRGKRDWSFVCNSPCNTPVDSDAEYRIAGDGVRSSSAFHLSGEPGSTVDIDVKPGSTGALAGGIVMTSLSVPTILVGLVVVAVASGLNSAGDSTGNASTVGWVVTGVGVGSLVGGILLLTGNAKTRVSQYPAAGQPSMDVHSFRLPTFDERRTVRVAGTPTVPLFSVTF